MNSDITRQETLMSKILACIDFSPLTDQIIEETRNLAEATSGEVMLISVIGDKPSQPHSVVHDDTLEEEGTKRRKQIKHLMNLKDDLVDAGIPCGISTPSGAVAESIAREAKEFQADWILMGSHGNGAMYHLVVGSVAEGVLKRTGKPVILIPGKQSAEH
jgi:nucleotide-binding universal stress UspA family protein